MDVVDAFGLLIIQRN